MKVSLAIASAVAAVLAAVAGSAPAATSAVRCAPPHGAKVIAAAAGSKVWLVRHKHPQAPSTVAYYGCEAGHPTIRLEKGDESPDEGIRVPAVALAGDLVGYGMERKAGLGSSTATVKVRDLRTGATIFAHHAVTTVDGLELFNRIVLAPTGAVAWIAANVADPDFTYEVWKADAAGVAELDRGTGIAPRSLALRAGAVSWTNGGAVMSAPLLGA